MAIPPKKKLPIPSFDEVMTGTQKPAIPSFNEVMGQKKSGGEDGSNGLTPSTSPLPSQGDSPLLVSAKDAFAIPNATFITPTGATFNIPAAYGITPDQFQGIQDRLLSNTPLPQDIEIIAKGSGKSPTVISAYLKSKDLGNAIDVSERISNNKFKFSENVNIANKLFDTHFDPEEILASPKTSSQFLQQIKNLKENKLAAAKNKDQTIIPGTIQGYDQSALSFSENTEKQFNDIQETLTDNITKLTADEAIKNGYTPEQTASLLHARLDPKGYAASQEMRKPKSTAQKIITSLNPIGLINNNLDWVTNKEEKNKEALNAESSQYELLANRGLQDLAIEKKAEGVLTGNNALIEESNQLISKIKPENEIIEKSPLLMKQQMADYVNKRFAEDAGILEGTKEEGKVSKLNLLFGVNNTLAKKYLQEGGFYDNPAYKDYVPDVVNNPKTYFADNSPFGSVPNSFLKPFVSIFNTASDLAGSRTNADRHAENITADLFPEQLTKNVKEDIAFDIDKHHFGMNVANTINSTANLAGYMAIAAATGGASSAVGLSANTAARLGAWGSFGMDAVDSGLKEADKMGLSPEASWLYAGMKGAMMAEGGRLLEFGKTAIPTIRGVNEELAKAAIDISEKKITQDAAKELLNGAANKWIEGLKKYGVGTAKGAAVMSAFGVGDNLLKIGFGDENIKTENILPEAANAYFNGLFTMGILGSMGLKADIDNAKNSTYKGMLSKIVDNHDAAHDVLKIGLDQELYTPEEYNQKVQILNTGIKSKATLEDVIARTGITLTPEQKSVWVANKTAEEFLRNEAAKGNVTEKQSKEFIQQADNLLEQSTKTLDGLKFNKFLEPRMDLYNAETELKQAQSDFAENDTPENEQKVLAKKEIVDAYNLLPENNYALFGTDAEKIKFIAEQAQNVQGDGTLSSLSTPEESYKAVSNQFGKALVDAAIKIHPLESLIKKETKATEVPTTQDKTSATDESLKKVEQPTEETKVSSTPSTENKIADKENEVKKIYSDLTDKAIKAFTDAGISEDAAHKTWQRMLPALVNGDNSSLSKMLHKDNKVARKLFEDITGLKFGKDITQDKIAESKVPFINNYLNRISEQPKTISTPSTVGGSIEDVNRENYNGIFSTEVSSISDKGKGTKDILRPSDNRKIVMMSPDDYLTLVREGLNNNIVSTLKRGNADKALIEKYEQKIKNGEDDNLNDQSKTEIKASVEKGDKIDMPFVFFNENGEMVKQDGRNRAAYAKEIGEKLIPVLIENKPQPKSEIKGKGTEGEVVGKEENGFDTDALVAKRTLIGEYSGAKELAAGQLSNLIRAVKGGQEITNIEVGKEGKIKDSERLGGKWTTMVEYGNRRSASVSFENKIDAENFANKIKSEYDALKKQKPKEEAPIENKEDVESEFQKNFKKDWDKSFDEGKRTVSYERAVELGNGDKTPIIDIARRRWDKLTSEEKAKVIQEYRDELVAVQNENKMLGAVRKSGKETDKKLNLKSVTSSQSDVIKSNNKRIESLKEQISKREADLKSEQEKNPPIENKTKEEGRFEEAAKKLAEKVRSGKINKLGGFKTSTGFDAVWDASLEVVAKTLETTGKIADAIEAGLNHIKESDWYKGLTDKKDFEEKYREHLNKEFEGKEPPKPPIEETEEKSSIAVIQPKENRPPNIVEPPTNNIEIVSENEGTGMRHADTAEIRQEFGLKEYEKVPNTQEEWNALADARIEKGEMPDVLKKLRSGEHPSPVEQKMMGKYIADLKAKAEETKSDKDIAALDDAVKLSDRIGGSETAKSLVARKGTFINEESLGAYFIRELQSAEVDNLTPEQKETVEKEFTTIDKAQKDWDAQRTKLNEEITKLKAQAELIKTKKAATSRPRTTAPKTHADHVEYRKKVIENIREKLKKARTGESGLTAVPVPYARELFAIAPDVAKLVKDLVEEGVTNLADVVKNIHGQLKPLIDEITESDVHNIIAGEYNKKQKTKNELQTQLEDLRVEAKLITRLHDLLKGEEPKNPKDKIKRNQQIKSLRDKIKDFKKEDSAVNKFYGESDAAERRIEKMEDELQRLKDRKDKEPSEKSQREISEREKEVKEQITEERKKVREGTSEANKFYKEELDSDAKKLISLRNRNKKATDEIQKAINEGRFAKPVAKTPLLEDKELRQKFPKLFKDAQDAKDKLIKARTEREIRLLQQEYSNRTKSQRIKDATLEILNVPRTLMSSIDFSAPLRQAVIPTISHPKLAAKAFVEMFRQSVSQKRFDRWFFDLRQDPEFAIMEKSGLYVADPHDLKLSAKEEQFMNNLAEKIPLIGKLVKGSERAYVSYLNKMRVDLFKQGEDLLKSQGKTIENAEKEYKALGSWVNNATGRGSFAKAEVVSPYLNTVFFSPRLIASRLNLLNPVYYYRLPKNVRNMALADMGKFVGFGLSVLALSALAGADVEKDPRSTDFGKIKVGNTRYDIWGGFQQYARFIAQVLSGQAKSQKGKIRNIDGSGRFGEDRGDLITRFFRGKLAPLPATAVDLITGRTIMGDKIVYKVGGNQIFDYGEDLKKKQVSATDEALKLVMPLVVSDVASAIKDQGVKALGTVWIPATFGVGVQSYETKK